MGQRGGALPGHDAIAKAKEGIAWPPVYGARSTAPAMTSWGGVWDSVAARSPDTIPSPMRRKGSRCRPFMYHDLQRPP